MRARALTAVIAGTLLIGVPSVPSAAPGRSGHHFRVVAVLATLPALASVTRPPNPTNALRQAVKACDQARLSTAVANGETIPTSAGAGSQSDCSVLPLRNSEARLLLAPLAANPALGTPAGLSGRDLRVATARSLPGSRNTVELTLTPAGATKLDGLAASVFGRPSLAGEAAFVVDGLVDATAVVQAPSSTTPVVITGDFTASQARSLAAIINAARHSG